jgi:hypothetical protein
LFDVEGDRFDVAIVGVDVSESDASRGLTIGSACAEGRPKGPNVWRGVGLVWVAWVAWVAGVADVLRVLADGVLRRPDGIRGVIEGAGKRSSVYILSRILERPTMAAGWSAKLFSADSNCASAV